MKTKSAKGQSGAALVEFAIILPLLLLLIMGIIEFSLLLYDKAVITNASREGARFGIVFRTDRPTEPGEPGYDSGVEEDRLEEIENIVNTYVANNLVTFGNEAEPVTPGDPPYGLVFDLPNGPCANHGDDLIVDVSYRYDFLVFPNILSNLFGGIIPEFINLNARTVMRCE